MIMTRRELELHTIDLNLLVALDALLSEVNVTRAAKSVGLSQSAMSHALRRLRELLGDPLLVRGAAGMTLTPRAELLGAPVRRGLIELRSALNVESEFDPASTRRQFVLGAPDYGQAGLLPRLWARIASDAPGLTIHVRSWQGTVGEYLEAGTIDVAVVANAGNLPGIMRRPLFTDRFVCVVRADHPRVTSELDLDTYLALDHILFSPDGTPRGIIDGILARTEQSRHVAVSVPHMLVALHMVARSDLILTSPAALLSGLTEMLGLRTLQPPLDLSDWTFKLVWHERYQHDPAHRWLREAIIEAASAEEASSRAT